MTYVGLTTADKPALLDAKANGKTWVVFYNDKSMRFFDQVPYLGGTYSVYCMEIDKALAQIAEMESKPLMWNERINQMTAEEKADVAVIISKRCSTALEKESCPDLTCWQCFIEFLNSPYTEGETK